MKKHMSLVEDYIIIALLGIILLVIAIQATTAEGIHKDIVYPEAKNKWGPVDVICHHHTDQETKSSLELSINNELTSFNDQDIILQFSDGYGVSAKTINILFGSIPSIPASEGMSNLYGLSLGFANYSDVGTSIYLNSYSNSTSWVSGVGNINAIFVKALQKSTYGNSEALTVKSYTGNKIKISSSSMPGLSININKAPVASIFGISTQNYIIDDSSVHEGYHDRQNVMVNYINTLDVVDYSNKELRNKTSVGTSMLRCIDPSFAPTKYNCNDLLFHPGTPPLYYDKKVTTFNNIICTEGETPAKDKCGVPYCYNGTTTTANYYATNNFANNSTSKDAFTDTNNYYLGKPVNDNKLFQGGRYDDGGSKIASFRNAPQAQKLLFCSGTSINNNNISNASMTTTSAKFPLNLIKNSRIPYVANSPNAQVNKDQVTLGFK
jgi:hypothetical protein